MNINEIYHCFSGEGGSAGRRCVIVRASGCPLRCTFCDTKYAFAEGEEISTDEILNKVRSFNCKFVLLTGGEPLAQPDACHELVRAFTGMCISTLVETSGVCTTSPVRGIPFVSVDLDIKTPSSGMSHVNDADVQAANIRNLARSDEVKFVIGNREDYVYALAFVKIRLLDTPATVYFSPVWEGGQRFWQELQKWILEDKLDVRFSLQQHKVVYGPTKRGV